jgi:hypothetical protein
MNRVEAYLSNVMPSVEGWFYTEDAVCFIAIDHIQKAWGITGALAEVGVYCGKSLGLLAIFRTASERVLGFDLFTGPASLKRTQQTIRDAVGDLTGIVLVTADSFELPATKLKAIVPEPMRFLHIDAGHEYEQTLSDLEKFSVLLGAGGVIAMDDYYDRDFPGVCAATNDFTRRSDFVPFLAGRMKLYLCQAEYVETYIEWLLRYSAFQQKARLARFVNRPMLIGFTYKPQPHEQILEQLKEISNRGV